VTLLAFLAARWFLPLVLLAVLVLFASFGTAVWGANWPALLAGAVFGPATWADGQADGEP
jgi:hypothetical protein